MKSLIVVNKKTDERMVIDGDQMVGVETKTLYIRKGYKGGLFLSQKGNGGSGAGDICRIDGGDIVVVEVNDNLFARIKVYAQKAGALT